MASSKDSYFIVTYRDAKEDKVVECKARTIVDSSLGLSFISISDFVFINKDSVVVDPNEEYLQKRLKNVRSFHLSIYSIISVEEVGFEQSALKLSKDRSNILVLNGDSNSPKPPTSPAPK